MLHDLYLQLNLLAFVGWVFALAWMGPRPRAYRTIRLSFSVILPVAEGLALWPLADAGGVSMFLRAFLCVALIVAGVFVVFVFETRRD